jgi:hypothetical protein
MTFETQKRHNKTEAETEERPVNTGARHMMRIKRELEHLAAEGWCLQCGGPIGPGSREITVRSTGDWQLANVHSDCFDAWQRRGPSQ